MSVKAIVVTDDPEVHALLAAGTTGWSIQGVASLQDLWQSLEDGTIDGHDVALVVLATRNSADRHEIVAAAATLARHALTMIVTWADALAVIGLRQEILDAANDNAAAYPAETTGDVRLIVDVAASAATAVRKIIAAGDSPLLRATATRPRPTAAESTPASAAYLEPTPQPLPAAPPRGTVIAVTSPVGGAGTSTIALGVAGTASHASAAAGAPLRVLVIDLDDRGRPASPTDLWMGDRNETTGNLGSAVTDAIAAATPWPSLGVDWVAAPPPRATGWRSWVSELAATGAAVYDVVVIDAPSHVPAAAVAVTDKTVLVCPLRRHALALAATRAQPGTTEAARTVLTLNACLPGTGVTVQEATAALPGVRFGVAIPSAARDVALAANHDALDRLVLTHAHVAPQLFTLTRVLLSHHSLASPVLPVPV